MRKNMFKTIQLLTVSLTLSATVYAQEGKMQLFKLSDVRLTDSPFKNAEEVDLAYMLKLEPDRLLAPYLREAGLPPKAESYGNWESSGLDGHTGGHYLTALAQMYAATGNTECKRRMDYMVDELARCQAKNNNGYVGGVPGSNKTWAAVKAGDFTELNKLWVPWYNLHKVYAGLRDAYILGGNARAKDAFIKLCDWADDVVAGLSTAQMQRMLDTEHGGMNEVIADAYALTGNKKYLALAQKFSHQALLLPLSKQEDNLTGIHANTQIPKIIGFERIAQLNNDAAYTDAAKFFWNTVVNNRSISIGGNSVREHFNPVDNFSTMLESDQGPETCNSNNMLKLSKMLFTDETRPEYIDYYERLLYNHILSSQHPDTGGFVYFTPIHPQHYRVYSTADQSFWCCVGTGIENHGKYGELIYSHKDDNLYVNLFIPSVLDWKEKGIEITQKTNFPEAESTDLTLKLKRKGKFSVFIRKPHWVTEGFGIKVNGKTVSYTQNTEGYVQIDRTWKSGDNISVSLPMNNSVEYLPDNSAWVSFLHGPIVMAAPTGTKDLTGLRADDSRWGHIAGGPMYPLPDAPLLASNDNDLSTAMHKVSTAQPLTYEISSLIVQPGFKNLELVPFYKVHDSRYMLYWPVAKKDGVKQRQEELAQLDERYIKLAARTVDAVAPGEQQPENDHGMVAEQSETGIFKNTHWRSSAAYFSYRLRINPQAKTLGVTYYGKESGREFDIFINDTKLIHVTLQGIDADALITKEYALPENVKAEKGTITVKFVASPGSKTASIYDVRLLR
ncbi:beta-L-arabinofuranosidase domain-containing protein [Flavobacterium sp. RHBU_24]|uniref:beta-L-arabinofuranosidase domain-containing protein n=1 Tax=Flavobacterium sp. RHBU_24 TaxID=3391185 RepID=UPI00398524B9